MPFLRTHLNQTIVIDALITLFYFEFGKEYAFTGESHPFWELVYVDKGEVAILSEDREILLRQGMIAFHKPDEFHNIRSTGKKAPNVIVLSFDCASPAMKQFEKVIMPLSAEGQHLLARIVHEGKNAFTKLRHPLRRYRRKDAPVGSEQLLKLYVEALLILLLRELSQPSGEAYSVPSLSEKTNHSLVEKIKDYLEGKIDSKVTLTQISDDLYIAKSTLKALFKKSTGHTVMDYFLHLKIDRAKLLIREEPRNFSEIARMTGFSSVHHFSRAFKKSTGMSPSEYAKSVLGRVKAPR